MASNIANVAMDIRMFHRAHLNRHVGRLWHQGVVRRADALRDLTRSEFFGRARRCPFTDHLMAVGERVSTEDGSAFCEKMCSMVFP